MKALVTGAQGFLGGALVRRLLAEGESVRALVRRPAPELAALGVEVHTAPLTDRTGLIEAARGADCVFHCAAKAGVWGSWKEYHDSNVVGTANVIDACQLNGVPRLVHTSSPSATFGGHDSFGEDESTPYPETFLNFYSETKAASEKLVLAAHGQRGLATIALRPHLIWGPGDAHIIPRVIRAAREGRLRRVGHGANQVDTTYVDNAVHAHVLAAARPTGKAYFISDDRPVRLWDFIDRILADVGEPPIRGYVPVPVARSIGSVLEWVYRTFRLPGEPPLTRFSALQLGLSHYYDISAAKRDLGYQAVVDHETAFSRTVAALR